MRCVTLAATVAEDASLGSLPSVRRRVTRALGEPTLCPRFLSRLLRPCEVRAVAQVQTTEGFIPPPPRGPDTEGARR